MDKTHRKENRDNMKPKLQQSSIGLATMQKDGTIILNLRAEDGDGMIGDARLVYPTSHPEYQKILQHLGGLLPGENKPVPPWPDN